MPQEALDRFLNELAGLHAREAQKTADPKRKELLSWSESDREKWSHWAAVACSRLRRLARPEELESAAAEPWPVRRAHTAAWDGATLPSDEAYREVRLAARLLATVEDVVGGSELGSTLVMAESEQAWGQKVRRLEVTETVTGAIRTARLLLDRLAMAPVVPPKKGHAKDRELQLALEAIETIFEWSPVLPLLDASPGRGRRKDIAGEPPRRIVCRLVAAVCNARQMEVGAQAPDTLADHLESLTEPHKVQKRHLQHYADHDLDPDLIRQNLERRREVVKQIEFEKESDRAAATDEIEEEINHLKYLWNSSSRKS